MKTFRYVIIFLFTLNYLIAKEIPTVSSPPKLVNDFSGTLTKEEIIALESKLVKYNDSTSTQICVVLENSLEGDELFDYSIRLAQAWGVGQKGKNNGVLIYVAVQDRKIRIQVGYGLEAVLTDAACKSIIEQVIKPKFKQGQYFAGLYEASDYIIAYAKGQYKAEPKSPKSKTKSLFVTLFVIILILYFLSKFFGRGGSNYGSGGGGMDWWTAAMLGSALSRGSGRSYGDFSSGSGSFGGFGGGSFGGGGAGGDW